MRPRSGGRLANVHLLEAFVGQRPSSASSSPRSATATAIASTLRSPRRSARLGRTATSADRGACHRSGDGARATGPDDRVDRDVEQLVAAVREERGQDGHPDPVDDGRDGAELAADARDLEAALEVILAERPDDRPEDRDVLRGGEQLGTLLDVVDAGRCDHVAERRDPLRDDQLVRAAGQIARARVTDARPAAAASAAAATTSIPATTRWVPSMASASAALRASAAVCFVVDFDGDFAAALVVALAGAFVALADALVVAFEAARAVVLSSPRSSSWPGACRWPPSSLAWMCPSVAPTDTFGVARRAESEG